MPKIEYNKSRLDYLLSLYGMTEAGLLAKINAERTRQFNNFNSPIDTNLLKAIDKIFNKGIYFYLDPTNLEKSKEASIFFRKKKFGTELNSGARKRVIEFEEKKNYLFSLAKLSDIEFERTLPIFKIADNPRIVANQIREQIYPQEAISDKRVFLKALVSNLAKKDVLVYEFVETHNLNETANIDGFYIKPNVIVLKRGYKKSKSREIFTLMHEIGHYLLNEEEIESVDVVNWVHMNNIEKWCSDFAYYFLIGEYADRIDSINIVDSSNDYLIDEIYNMAQTTKLSQLAIYTHLRITNKISQQNYNLVKKDLEDRYNKFIQGEEQKRDANKEEGRVQNGRTPQPLKSPLFVSTIETALYSGVINEFEFGKILNLPYKQLNKYIKW